MSSSGQAFDGPKGRPYRGRIPITGGFISIALALLAAIALSPGDSKPLTTKDLPAPVLAAFQKAYPSAKLKTCSSEKKDGKTCYELESMDGKTERDLIYAEDGSVMEMEEGIDLADLPEAAKQGISEKYPKATIKKAEKLTKGSDVSFEVVVKDGKKKMELAFDAQRRLKAKAKD